MKCPNCEKRISKNEDICPSCGYPLAFMATHSLESKKNFRTTSVHTDGNKKSQNKKKSPVGIIVGVIVLILGLTVGMIVLGLYLAIEDYSSDYDEEETIETEAAYTEVPELDQEAIVEQLDIYYYTYIDVLDSEWIFLEMYNDSDYDLSLEVTIETYDESGNLVESKNNWINAYEQETWTLLPFLLNEPYESFEIFIYSTEETYYESVISSMTMDQKTTDEGEVITVTNNGSVKGRYIEVMMLFLKGDEVVSYTSRYFGDSDYIIEPGESYEQLFESYVDYDQVVYYLRGTGEK